MAGTSWRVGDQDSVKFAPAVGKVGDKLAAMSRFTRILSRTGRMLLGQGRADPTQQSARATPLPRRWAPVGAYVGAVAQAVVTTVVAELLFTNVSHVERADIILLYILGIMVVAARCGRGPATVSAVLSVAAFDLFYIPPYLTFAVSNGRYILTFTVMLIVGLVISALTEQIRVQAEAARVREGRTAALYSLSRELTQLRDTGSIATCAARHIGEMLDGRALILLADAAGDLAPEPLAPITDPCELPAARWALARGPAGRGTSHFPGAAATYLPLTAADRTVGVLRIIPLLPTRLSDPDSRALLDALCRQTAIAIQHVLLAQEAQASEIRARTEELRSSLLSAVSHDLRTPLAVITGAATSLRDDAGRFAPETRAELLDTIVHEAARLERVLQNLLGITRVETGLQPTREWVPVEELVGPALDRVAPLLGAWPVEIDVPGELLVPIDPVLFEHVLINLVENAVKYGAPPISIAARGVGDEVEIVVRDRGAGLTAGSETRIFEKFFRAPGTRVPGVGLGLAVCRGIVEAHRGTITADTAPGGGARFRILLPAGGAPGPAPTEVA